MRSAKGPFVRRGLRTHRLASVLAFQPPDPSDPRGKAAIIGLPPFLAQAVSHVPRSGSKIDPEQLPPDQDRDPAEEAKKELLHIS